MDTHSLPYVSVILVTRNEEKFIEMSLMSLINQTYPKDKYEIIIAVSYTHLTLPTIA